MEALQLFRNNIFTKCKASFYHKNMDFERFRVEYKHKMLLYDSYKHLENPAGILK